MLVGSENFSGGCILQVVNHNLIISLLNLLVSGIGRCNRAQLMRSIVHNFVGRCRVSAHGQLLLEHLLIGGLAGHPFLFHLVEEVLDSEHALNDHRNSRLENLKLKETVRSLLTLLKLQTNVYVGVDMFYLGGAYNN